MKPRITVLAIGVDDLKIMRTFLPKAWSAEVITVDYKTMEETSEVTNLLA